MSSEVLIERPKTYSLKAFKKFLKVLLQEEKDDLWILVIYGVCVSICSLVIPIAVQAFVNTIGFGLLLQPILILTLIVFTVLVFSGTMTALQTYVTEVLQQRLFAKIAMAIALRVPQVEFRHFSKRKSVYEVNYFLEIATLQKTATVLVLDGSSVVLQIIFGLILLAFYHPFLLALNFIILLFIFVFFFGLARRATEKSIGESKAKYSVAAWLHEMASNSADFRSIESRAFAAKRTDELTSNYVLNRKEHFKVLFLQILAAIFLQIIVSSLLLGVGGWLVVRGQLTLGQLVASELIVSAVVYELGKFGKYLDSYYDLAASLDKIGHLFELPLERQKGEVPQKEVPNAPLIRVKEFVWRNNQTKNTSMPISFEVKPGEKLAIIGSDDVTRGALLKSLYGLEENYSGVIELEKLDLRYQSLVKLRSKIAYVGKSDLMSGTILDNLRLGNEDVTLPEIQQVLENLKIQQALSQFQNGLYASVHDIDFDLLPVLKRKILIARALLSKPSVILLDDIFDSSYFDDGLSMSSFFAKDRFPCSILIHARRRETVAFVDRIIDLDTKNLKEDG